MIFHPEQFDSSEWNMSETWLHTSRSHVSCASATPASGREMWPIAIGPSLTNKVVSWGRPKVNKQQLATKSLFKIYIANEILIYKIHSFKATKMVSWIDCAFYANIFYYIIRPGWPLTAFAVSSQIWRKAFRLVTWSAL